MALISFDVVIGRARAALNGAIDVCRCPPRGLPEAELRNLMRDAQSLAWEIEVVENFATDFNIRKKKALATELTMLDEAHLSGPTSHRRLIRRFKDHVDRLKGLTEKLKTYMPRIPTLKIAAKSYEVILASEIVDACFDAALLCEAYYEEVQTHRPVSEAMC
ncbi:hypothetical protein BAJUN_00210 [Bajunvirus bajun]|uniref:Uncharacterized protein n=1 Tax=Brevundimonas phage vB_BgoS-Bajun TaxID=2948594 RepID=A0A9E7N4B5_9CAUD|nr:hypothetical protein BAJUN_00210 [Brevundimonas phage vB_BgoS-Bajun]